MHPLPAQTIIALLSFEAAYTSDKHFPTHCDSDLSCYSISRAYSQVNFRSSLIYLTPMTALPHAYI